VNAEQFVTIIAICTGLGTILGTGFAAFFNNRKLSPIKTAMATVTTTAEATAKDFADLKSRYERLDRDFVTFRLEASYNRGKQEAAIIFLNQQLKRQSKEIDELKRQRDDLMRMLIIERSKVEKLNDRIKLLETEKDETERKLATARAASELVKQNASAA
jgi:predicted  nucleic acid-binding Zn-ribbon protein